MCHLGTVYKRILTGYNFGHNLSATCTFHLIKIFYFVEILLSMDETSKIHLKTMEIQWNLSKADTYGTEVFVRFREVSALERFELKSSQI